MQIIENWAEIDGKVTDISPSDNIEKFYAVEVRVEKVNGIKGFVNLIDDIAGKTVTIYMPSEIVEEKEIVLGSRIQSQVRKASRQRLFAHRDHVETNPKIQEY